MPEYTCKAEQCPSSETAAWERFLLECGAYANALIPNDKCEG